jgi:VWFA-related protein
MTGIFRLAPVATIAAMALAATGRAASQTSPASPPQTSGEMINIDFYALSADGKPIADLRPEEVAVRINGRAKAIKSLQFIEAASLASGPAAGETARPLPPPFGSNSTSGHGRAFIIVIDDESLRPGKERPMRAAIGQLLANLSARDRVSVVTVPHGGMKADLTTDHDKVSQAVAAITGQAPQDESGQDGACRTRNNLESLEGMLNSLAGGEGPTIVLFFSTGMLGPRRDSPITRAPGMCELTPQHFIKVGTAAAAARAHFYVIRPDEIAVRPGALLTETIAGAGFTGSDNPLEGLENLAGVTGGHRLSIPASGETTLIRIARETAGYYLAAVEPEGVEKDSASHGLDVRVTRPGVVVRSRPEFTTTRARPAPGAAAGVPAHLASMTPYEMLRTGRVLRDLPLRTAGYPSRHTVDDKIKVVFVAESADPAIKLTDAAAGLFDSQGRLVAIWNAEPADLAANSLLAALAVDPGSYRLRVAARDASGRSGTADYEVAAELPVAGPMKLSSLVLGLSRNGAFQPRLQFTTEPVALAYLELYGGTPGTRLSAIVEVAQNVESPALLTTPLALEASGEEGRYLATGAVAIGALPAGDFVVRAVVGVEGQPAGRVYRTLRIVK